MNVKFAFLIAIFFTSDFSWGQNLVPNANFSDFKSCPSMAGELDSCRFWRNPTRGTPDYFHACHDTLAGTTHTYGVPSNKYGYQESTSNSYIGIDVYNFGSGNKREYAETDIPSMIPGATYKVTMRISLADICYYATAAPSVFFYRNAVVHTTTDTVLAFVPQVKFGSDFITNMAGWTTVADTFVADSAYTHLVIGNFLNNASTAYTTVPSTMYYSYYYIDSVAVEKIADPSFITENEYAPSGFTLSPNPSTGTFTVQLPQGGMALATINDVAGRTVSTHVISHNMPINTALPPGIYILHVTTPTGTWRNKLVIQ
jgi:hypothetical protein